MPATISQRIALEGGAQIKAQLADLGQAGERAIGQIQSVAAASSSHWQGFSNVIASVRGGFSTLRESVAPVGEAFGELKNKFNETKGALAEMADRTIPHWRTIVELAPAAAIAGFVALAKSAADAAHEIEEGARFMGVSTDEFQALQLVAARAGIDQEKLLTGMAREAANLGRAAQQQKNAIIDLATHAMGTVGTLQATVLRGAGEASKKLASDVEAGVNIVRGGAAGAVQSLHQVQTAIGGLDPIVVKIHGLLAESLKGTPAVVPGIEAIRTSLMNAAEQSAKVRESLVKLGATVMPRTVGEALAELKTGTSDLATELTRLGPQFVRDMNDPIAILRDLANVWDQTTDKTQLALVASQLFGRQWRTSLLPVLAEIRHGLTDVTAEMQQLGINIGPAMVKTGQQLYQSFNELEFTLGRVKDLIVLAFAPSLVPLVERLTQAIVAHAKEIEAWAGQVAARVAPVMADFVRIISGEQVKTPWVQQLLAAFNAVAGGARIAFGVLKDGFEFFATLLQPVADGINAIFGTHLTGSMLAVSAILLNLTGAFGALASAIGLVVAGGPALWAFLASPAVLIPAALYALYAFRAQLAELGGPVLKGVEAGFKWLADALGGIFGQIGAAWHDYVVAPLAKGINELVGWIGGLISQVENAVAAIGRLLGAAPAGGAAPGFAGGGPVRGPGTSTSDSVPILASHGEFVVRASAVKHYGASLFAALNAMSLPRQGFALGGLVEALGALRPAPLKMATGGLVGTAGIAPGATINLAIGGEIFRGLSAPEDTAKRLIKYARTRSMLGAGRFPGWFGS